MGKTICRRCITLKEGKIAERGQMSEIEEIKERLNDACLVNFLLSELEKRQEEIDRLEEGIDKFRTWLLVDSSVENIPDEIYFPFINLLEEAK